MLALQRLLPLLLLVLSLPPAGGCIPGSSEEAAPAGETVAAPLTASSAADTAALEVRFLDVGQGDAVLIRSGEQAVLIDAGPANRIVAQLRALGIERLDLLLASHNHADHIGGMDAILDSLPVRFYLDNGHPAATRIQQRILERIEAQEITYLEPTARTIGLGDAQLHIIPAPEGVRGEEQNNRSVSVLLERGEFRALFTGDSETELLNALLAAGSIPRVQVLKAAHHGSRNGVTPGWIARTRPEVVAISVAERNNYGHPHEAAMRYYCTGGRLVLRTDQEGDVVVTVDEQGSYRVQTQRRGELVRDGESPACTAYSATAAAGEEGSP